MCPPAFSLYEAAIYGPGYMFAAASIYYFVLAALQRLDMERFDRAAFIGSLVAATLIVWVLGNLSRIDGDYKAPMDPPRNQTF